MHGTSADADLLRLSAEGDRGAFGIFMNRHADAVYRFLVALHDSADDVEDALQESFVSAWRSAGAFQGSSSARSWLFSIARNALRRQRRRRVGEPVEMEPLELLGAHAGWGATSDLSARFAAKDELTWALGQLSQDEREVLALRYLEGLSGREAADALGLSLDAMKSRLHRGRLRLMGVLRAREVTDA